MPVVSSELKFYYSGGGSNSSANLSLGGEISSVEVAETLHGLFDRVSFFERLNGRVEYRCIFIKNTNTTTDLFDVLVWVLNDPSEAIQISLASEGVGNSVQILGQETSVPIGETFVPSTSYLTALVIPSLPANQYQGLWIKRTIEANSVSISPDTATIIVEGQSE